jgi:hypothetical protein
MEREQIQVIGRAVATAKASERETRQCTVISQRRCHSIYLVTLIGEAWLSSD